MTPEQDLRKLASKKSSPQTFFKTLAEGDVFIGVSVPNIRRVAKAHKDLAYAKIEKLLKSKIHEERLLALRILADRFAMDPDRVYQTYMKNLKHVDNWDLVDTSAPEISGPYWFATSAKKAVDLARSKNIWERRVAMVSMFYFIRQKRLKEPLKIAEMLLEDEHDLIHKALGWMLRELGKRADRKALDRFLTKHAAKMPRTALRYAIERHTPSEKKRWMACRTNEHLSRSDARKLSQP